jgi:hypothetical protein
VEAKIEITEPLSVAVGCLVNVVAVIRKARWIEEAKGRARGAFQLCLVRPNAIAEPVLDHLGLIFPPRNQSLRVIVTGRVEKSLC